MLVKANCRADLVCSPGRVEFGTVAVGQTPTQTIDIEYAGKVPLQITEVVVPKGAPLKATVKEAYREPGKVGYRIEVSLKKGAAPGPLRESLLVKTNDPDSPRFSLPVDGEVEGPRLRKGAG